MDTSPGTLIAILKFLAGPLVWLWKQLFIFWAFLGRLRSCLWPKDLVFVPLPGDSFWHRGGAPEKVVIQIHALVHAFLRKGSSAVRFMDLNLVKPIRADSHTRVFGYDILQPEHSMVLWCDFSLPDQKWPLDRDQKISVELIDHLKRKWTIKGIPLRANNSVPEPGPPCESIHSLPSKVEQDMASLLKLEVDAYRRHGRREGHLGSMGPHGDGFNPDGGYAHALLRLHSNSDEDARVVLREGLIGRLSVDAEYASVAYVILHTLVRTGHLIAGLDAVKEKLKGDKRHAFGDSMLMIVALIRKRPDLFTDDELNAMDRFADETKDQHERALAERLQETIAKERARRIA